MKQNTRLGILAKEHYEISGREKSQMHKRDESCWERQEERGRWALKAEAPKYLNTFPPVCAAAGQTDGLEIEGLLSSLVPNQNIQQLEHGPQLKGWFSSRCWHGSRMNPCTDTASAGHSLDCHVWNQNGWKTSKLWVWVVSRENKNPSNLLPRAVVVHLTPIPTFLPPANTSWRAPICKSSATHCNILCFLMMVSI